jgi:hypothetical protein
MRLNFSAILILLLAGSAFSQTSRPAPLSADAAAALELRATETFNQGDYSIALPMLQRLAVQLQTQPDQADRLAMVQEQIRVCQKNQPLQLAAVTSVGDTSLTTPAGPPPIPMGADRKPHPAPKPGEVIDTTIKELGNFEYDAEHGSPIPPDVKALDGSALRLKGYMIPMDQAENISKFALVPSLFSCCYGQPPQIQHTIVVNCPKGKAISYYPDEIVVEGKLKVDEEKDDGFIVSIFEIETSSVKPAPK